MALVVGMIALVTAPIEFSSAWTLLEITTCPTQPAARSFPTVYESMANAIAYQHMPGRMLAFVSSLH